MAIHPLYGREGRADWREGKPPWQSKTLWINGLTVVAAFLGIALESAGLLVETGIDPRWVALVLGLVNIILRAVTREPLAGMEE